VHASFSFLKYGIVLLGHRHHGMARPEVADGGGGFQVWNILKKQLQRPDKEGVALQVVGWTNG
jgi:hypothetical protein